MVKFLINANKRDKYLFKLIRLLDQDVNKLLLLALELKAHHIIVKVIELQTSTVIFG